jgi:hypothetical protein
MPNPGAELPLRKVTVNLFDEDCTAAEAYYGRGWSEELRKLWHDHIRNTTGYHKLRQTLGDLP